jgi:hypothetical protein
MGGTARALGDGADGRGAQCTYDPMDGACLSSCAQVPPRLEIEEGVRGRSGGCGVYHRRAGIWTRGAERERAGGPREKERQTWPFPQTRMTKVG